MKMKLIAAASAAFAVTITRVDATNWNGTGTGVSAASCEPSTVYIPVTQNVTTTETVLYSSPSTDLTTVLITTVAATTTVTAGPSVSQAAVSSSSSEPYIFSVVDSSTLWKGGVSPTSGAQLSVATSVVTLSPIDSTAADITTSTTLTSTSTIEKLTTITLPATTSTAYSMLSTLLTTTSTSTNYVTMSLSAVPSRSSFSGMSSAGWNASSAPDVPTQTPVLPAMTTLTETHYYGSGNLTTSTSTNRITTTLGAIITTTLQPPATVVTVSVPGAPLSVTTVTAAPVTVTYTVQTQPLPFSTSVSFSSVQSSTEVGAAAAATSGANSTLPAATISTQPGLPLLSNLPVIPSSSSTNASTSTFEAPGATLPATQSSSGIVVASAATATEAGSSSAPANVSSAGLPTAYSAPTAFTVTSFLSGSGTTLTLTSLPGLTTPMSVLSSTSSGTLSTAGLSSGILTGSEITSAHSSSVAGSIAATGSTSSGASFTTSQSTPSSTVSTGPSSAPGSSGSSTVSVSSSSASTVPAGSKAQSSGTSQSTKSGTVTSQSSPTSSTSSRTLTTSTLRSASQSRNGTVSVSASKTASSTFSDSFPASSATAIPTRGCGEQGNFTMGFDDLPAFHPDRSVKRNNRRQSNGTTSNDNDITQQPPLDLRPYHHLTFSNGFVYGPQSVEPFVPVSEPNVAAFLANGTGMRTGNQPGDVGEIGDGPGPDDVSAFWFDAFSAFLGCDNGGPGNCTMEVTGLHWDPLAKDETPAFSQNYTLAPCPSLRNCALTPITFPSTARSLSGLEIRAVRNGEPRMFFMDDMHMAWSNKTCDAGMLRQSTQ